MSPVLQGLAACLLLQAQGPLPAPAAPGKPGEGAAAASAGAPGADEGWTLVNRVAVIINEDIVTMRDVLSRLRILSSKGLITTEQDFQRAETGVLSDEIRRKLQVQAGQDLGLPREVLDRQLDNVMKRQIESAGGVTELSDRLKEQRTDSLEQRQRLSDEMYSQVWVGIVTGEYPGTQGRPTRDRYVRPGVRLFVYRTLLDSPERFGDFGGKAPEFVVQLLVVPYDKGGGRDGARELAGELRDLALGSEDFAGLIERYGALTGKKAVFHIDEARLAQVDPTFAEFLKTASPGDISPVHSPGLVDERGHELQAWAIARLVERSAAETPEFSAPAVQQKLQELVERSYDTRRHESALVDLFRGAYVWPPEFAAPRLAP
jgi:hypothetical protein